MPNFLHRLGINPPSCHTIPPSRSGLRKSSHAAVVQHGCKTAPSASSFAAGAPCYAGPLLDTSSPADTWSAIDRQSGSWIARMRVALVMSSSIAARTEFHSRASRQIGVSPQCSNSHFVMRCRRLSHLWGLSTPSRHRAITDSKIKAPTAVVMVVAGRVELLQLRTKRPAVAFAKISKISASGETPVVVNSQSRPS